MSGLCQRAFETSLYNNYNFFIIFFIIFLFVAQIERHVCSGVRLVGFQVSPGIKTSRFPNVL